MTTDLKSKTPMQRLCDLYRDVEYLSNNNISEVRAISTAYLDVARRLEEAQRRIKELEDFFGAHDDEEALLKNELFEAQQKIVAQQARIEQLRGYACSCNTMHGELLFPCRVHDRPELDDLSALTAHDAELTAKAKAEALEEARAGIDTIDDGEQPAYRHCQEFLGEKAAEYRAKAKG